MIGFWFSFFVWGMVWEKEKDLRANLQVLGFMARLGGFEPTAVCLEGRCSIRLSYRRALAGFCMVA